MNYFEVLFIYFLETISMMVNDVLCEQSRGHFY